MVLYHLLVYAFITTIVGAANINLTEILAELPPCSVSDLKTRSRDCKLTRAAPLYHRWVQLLARFSLRSTVNVREHGLTAFTLDLYSK